MGQDLGFHRKYRPVQLKDYVGNTQLKKRVEGILESTNKPQVVLLEGSSGCGKTTMARLLAKEYLCERGEHGEHGACGVCVTCKSVEKYIHTGNFGGVMNLNEYDIGSIGKRDISAILEEMSVPSYLGGWRVYILDEVHLLSQVAQGTLLKTLEEPPKDVLIILCTTDPQKLLDTVLSRCQYKLKVEKPTVDELVELLKYVCIQEKVKYEVKGLNVLAGRSGLTFRQGLTMLESVITEHGVVSYKNVVDTFGLIADKYFLEFYRLILQEQSVSKYISFIGNLKANMSICTYVEDLEAFTVRGIYACNGVIDGTLDNEDVKRYKKLFKDVESDAIIYILSKLLDFVSNSQSESELILFGYNFIEGRYKGVEAFTDESRQEVMDELNVARENAIEQESATDEDIKNIMSEFF